MIVFLSCTKSKLKKRCAAKELYTASTWFRYAYKYAESLNPTSIYILSAKYGLLEPGEIIEPYEKTLKAAKDIEIKKWSIMVINQMKKKNVDFNDNAVFLCGKNYRKYISLLFKNKTAPFCNLKNGQQVAYMKERLKTNGKE